MDGSQTLPPQLCTNRVSLAVLPKRVSLYSAYSTLLPQDFHSNAKAPPSSLCFPAIHPLTRLSNPFLQTCCHKPTELALLPQPDSPPLPAQHLPNLTSILSPIYPNLVSSTLQPKPCPFCTTGPTPLHFPYCLRHATSTLPPKHHNCNPSFTILASDLSLQPSPPISIQVSNRDTFQRHNTHKGLEYEYWMKIRFVLFIFYPFIQINCFLSPNL